MFVFRRRDPDQPASSKRLAIPFTTGLFVACLLRDGGRDGRNNPVNSLIGYAILAAGRARMPLLAAQEPNGAA